MYTSCAGLRFTNQIWVVEIHQSHHHQPLLGILKTKDNLSVIDRINFDLADNFFVSMCANKKNLIFMTNRWFLGNKWFYFRWCCGLIGGWCYFNLHGDWQKNELFKPTMKLNYLNFCCFSISSIWSSFPAVACPAKEPLLCWWVMILMWSYHKQIRIHNFDDTLLGNYVLEIGGPWAINYYIYQVILLQMYD